MSNKQLFSNKPFSSMSKVAPYKVTKVATATNQAGGVAYSLDDSAALAQLAMTGCFNGAYYTSSENQLQLTLELANKVDVKFVAKLAVFARQKGLMKDMPALLTAVVAGKDSALFAQIFPLVIDSPKMLRNFVQIIRSGVTGRNSLGTRPKKLIQKYLENLTDEQLFKADVGNDPSLQDIIKLVHPKPHNKNRSAMYAYLLGKDHDANDLCQLVKDYESFKKDMSKDMPNVPFQMLTALPLTDDHWKKIAQNATWNQIRMNLNTFQRHNVLNDNSIVDSLSEKLINPELVAASKVFPYQLFTTFLNVANTIPNKLSIALQKAADHTLSNIPQIDGKIFVMVDTSGSMNSPITGDRGSVTTKMRCIDAAALFASAIMRKNPNTEIIPFDTRVHLEKLNPMDSIMTNAKILSSFGGGGTNCSSALAYVNERKAKGDLVIYISDNESWIDSSNYRQTATMNEWNIFKERNPNSKLVCINIQPYVTTQAHSRVDILNIGGFNDTIFDVIARFYEIGNDKDLWVKTIESMVL